MAFGGGQDGARFLVKPRSVGPVSSASGGQAKPGQTTRDAVRGALRRLRAGGGTPLLRALDLGLNTLLSRPAAKPEAIRALVMVTDGRDTVGGPNPGPATARARKAGVRVYVIATGSVDCSQPVLAAVTSDSGGRCMVAEDGPETTADALTAAIWGVSGG
jgi:Mg-chelatase subunit ChlD